MVKIVEREMHLPPVYGNFANYIITKMYALVFIFNFWSRI